MGHTFYLSEERFYVVGTIATLLFTLLLTIIAFMWIRIEQQKEIISNLHIKILKEPVTIPAALGIIMTLAGLFLSEQKTTKKGEPKIWTTKMKNV